MYAPVSWLRELTDVPADATGEDVAATSWPVTPGATST